MIYFEWQVTTKYLSFGSEFDDSSSAAIADARSWVDHVAANGGGYGRGGFGQCV